MKHLQIKADGRLYTATIKLEYGSSDSVVFQSIGAASKEAIESALVELGFHRRDVMDAFAFAEGKGANTPHPFFEEALKKGR